MNSFSVRADGVLLKNGTPVKQEAVPFHTTYDWAANGAKVKGPFNHFQDGCGDPFSAFMSRRVSAHLSVQRSGDVIQYVSFNRIAYHAYAASFNYIGIEAAVGPGSCDWTLDMLDVLAQLDACVMEWAQTKFGIVIPTVRSPGGVFAPGIKFHCDGLAPDSSWDPNGHWDGPCKATNDPTNAWVDAAERTGLNRSPWFADDLIAKVKFYRGEEDDMTPEEKAMLSQAFNFAKTVKEGLTAQDFIHAGTRVKNAVLAVEGGHTGPAEPDDPAKPVDLHDHKTHQT